MLSSHREIHELLSTTQFASCECSRWSQDEAPCRHILFFRAAKNLSLFEKFLFADFYHIERVDDLMMSAPKPNYENPKNVDNVISDIIDNDEEKPSMMMPNPYRMVKEETDNLRDIILHHGEKQRQTYYSELKVLQKRVRLGRTMLNSGNKLSKSKKSEMLPEDPPDKLKDCINEVSELTDDSPTEVLNFLEITKSKGRPKGVKSSKTSFPKPKNKDIVKPPSMSSFVDRNDNQDEDDRQVIAYYPPNGQETIGRIPLMKLDYMSLRPSKFIYNSVIDYKSKSLQPHGPAGQHVWVITSNLGQALIGGMIEYPDQVREARLWQPGGCKVVMLPIVEHSHFFLLVAILEDDPQLFVLESIGE